MSAMNATMTTSESGKWATFHLAGEMFAVRVEDVQEVLMPQPLTPVPLAPDHIVGLLNLRGQLMPAFNLRRRLQAHSSSAAPAPAPTAVLVVKDQGHLISILVDEIGDVLDLKAESWRPPPDTLAPCHRAFVFGICPIDGCVVLGLRVDAVGADERAPQ